MKNLYFVNNGLYIDPYFKADDDHLMETLPTGTYKFVTHQNRDGGKHYHFAHVTGFEIQDKYYGDLERHSQHIMRGYQRNTNGITGVLLYGKSGTGKSLLAKHLSASILKEAKRPTIISGKDSILELETLFGLLKQPAVILIDEFEKMFENVDQQNYLLSLLDGTNNLEHNHLIILTANELERVSPYLLNRPSRLRYAIVYNYLNPKIIRKLVDDCYLNNDEFGKEMRNATIRISMPTYDVIMEFIDECNRFLTTSPIDILDIFNVSTRKIKFSDYRNVKLTSEDGTNVYNLLRSFNFDIKDLRTSECVDEYTVGARVYPIYTARTYDPDFFVNSVEEYEDGFRFKVSVKDENEIHHYLASQDGDVKDEMREEIKKILTQELTLTVSDMVEVDEVVGK